MELFDIEYVCSSVSQEENMDHHISIAHALRHLETGDAGQINLLAKDISSGPDVTTTTLSSFFASGGVLVLARHSNQIIGFGTLVPVTKISGTTGRVEHVVMKESERGKGISKAIMAELIRCAKASGYRYVDLSTGEDNTVANGLYARVGFTRRKNVTHRLVFS